jgi:hypothetical protein
MLLNMSAIPRLLAFVVIAATATACFGDNEPEQRKAFINFLQTRVIDRPGVKIPNPSADEVKSLGNYITHFNVITGFTGDPALTAMAMKMSSGLPNLSNIQSVIDNRDTLRRVGGEMGSLLRTMNDKYAATQKERDALKQPDDLKAVYDKAFDKTVTAPVNAFREAVPIAQAIVEAAANLADYVVGHKDTVRITGGQLQPTSPRAQAELAPLVNAIAAQGTKFNEAQRKLRTLLTGN